MICNNCGEMLKKEATFCRNCGAKFKTSKAKKPTALIAIVAVLTIALGIGVYFTFFRNDYITRAEWIVELTDTMGYSNEYISSTLFSDVKFDDNAFYNIQIAVAYGLIDTDNDRFNPNAPATREFVAVSAAKAVGFFGTPRSELNDISDLANSHLIALTVDNGLFESTNGNFVPNGRITAEQSGEILEKIIGFTTLKIDPNHVNTITYRNDVVNLLESFDALISADDDFMNVQLSESYGSKLEVGTVYLLPPTRQIPTGIARKVRSISFSDGVYTVENEEVELEEVYQELSVQGVFYPDFDNIIWAEGVTVNDIGVSNNALNSEQNDYEIQTLAYRPESNNQAQSTIQANPLSFQGFERAFSMNVGGTEVSGVFALHDLKVTTDIEYLAGALPIRIGVLIEERSSMSWSVSRQYKPEEDIKIFEVPIHCFAGVVVMFRAYLTVEGELSITYSQENTTHHWINVLNSGQASNSKIIKSEPRLEAEASLKLGLKPALSLNILSVDLVEFSFFIGVHVLYARTLPDECVDLFIYMPLYVKIELLPELNVIEASFVFHIFTEDNSPFRQLKHIERSIIVPECTLGGDSVTGEAPPGRPPGGFQSGPTVSIPCGEWQQHYIRELQRFDITRNWNTPREIRLIFINDDNIPEIVIFPDARNQQGILLTATNERADRIEFYSNYIYDFDYTLYYFERSNRFAYFEGVGKTLAWISNERVSEIQNGSFVNLHKGDYFTWNWWDDQYVTKEEYSALRDQYFDYDSALTPMHSFYISAFHTPEMLIELILSLCGQDCGAIHDSPTPNLTTPGTTPSSNNEDNALENLNIGDIIDFGDLRWRVLTIEADRALIITEEVIEYREYHTALEYIVWDHSTIRSYLNNEFLNSFNTTNQNRIIEANVINSDNPEYGTPGGNNTIDKIFLLSIDEVLTYFADDSTRVAFNSNGVPSWWRLRSPGKTSYDAAFVDDEGFVFIDGDFVFYNDSGIRPALWLSLSQPQTTVMPTPTSTLSPIPDPNLSYPDGLIGTWKMTSATVANYSGLHANFGFYSDGTVTYIHDAWLETGYIFYMSWYYDVDGSIILDHNNTPHSSTISHNSFSDSTMIFVDSESMFGRELGTFIKERID
ncbi:MAG: DUF6273 domain-containing protein [Oscillospiraceae bacterium]|jgi:hypothetical protein|nr:DUF6273 domain-containing protein [Oscillospiraceae bacterium]